jgi:hypothetical protein
VDVNAESSLLQPANRDGGIDQDWAGDDQDWWDWYVTLAENDDAPIALVAGPGLPDVDPADDEQLRVELAAPTDLMLPSVKPSVVMPSSSWRMCFHLRWSADSPNGSTACFGLSTVMMWRVASSPLSSRGCTTR